MKEGRQKEYAALNLGEAPPDPQQERTFRSSRLNWSLRDRPSHAELLELYRRLLELRRWAPRVCRVEAERERRTVTIVRQGPAGLIGAVLNFDLDPKPLAVPAGESWRMMDVGQLPAELPPFGFVLLTSER